jgi:hypothetical protein
MPVTRPGKPAGGNLPGRLAAVAISDWGRQSQSRSKSRGDQLCNAVSAEYYGSKAACNDGKKKCGCCGVFHGGALSTKKCPAIRNQLGN